MNNKRRHTPVNHRNTMKIQGPSKLASLDGSRKPGELIRHYATTKAPKRRFNIGNRFQYDGAVWELIYMYRLKTAPGVWYHCLEERTDVSKDREMIGAAFSVLGAGVDTPRIVFSEFPDSAEADKYFDDIYAHGSRTTKTTQQLLALKRVD